MKKSEKILNGQGCRTGTDLRTHARTHVRERIYRFLPESKDIWGTNKRSNYIEQKWAHVRARVTGSFGTSLLKSNI